MERKLIFALFFVVIAGISYAQRPPVIGVVMSSEADSGITAAEVTNITNRIIAELRSWGSLNVVQGSQGSEYYIRGNISRQDDFYVLSAVTINASNERVLDEYSDQIATGNDVSLLSFCARAVDRVPMPNYLLGTWQSTLNMPDGPIVCIIEFKSDRTAVVEKYDTWEHRQNNAIRYEGYGRGTYSYSGYANRIVNVSSRQTRIDAVFGVNLRLEESLPDQSAVNRGGLGIVFNADKSSFEIVNGMLPCGTNYDGASVYPSSSLGFYNFTKIQ
jgi:hypothetical protein